MLINERPRIEEAAEQFTGAIVRSHEALARRGVYAQEQGTQLTELFVKGWITALRTQAEQNLYIAEKLADQQQRQTAAAQALAQESVDAYVDFVGSVLPFWQGSAQKAHPEEVGSQAGGVANLPIADYDSLNVRQATARLEGLSVEELRQVRDYEARTKNRSTLLEKLDEEIEAGSTTTSP